MDELCDCVSLDFRCSVNGDLLNFTTLREIQRRISNLRVPHFPPPPPLGVCASSSSSSSQGRGREHLGEQGNILNVYHIGLHGFDSLLSQQSLLHPFRRLRSDPGLLSFSHRSFGRFHVKSFICLFLIRFDIPPIRRLDNLCSVF